MQLNVDPHTVPPELKNEGSDWFAIFNPAPSEPGRPAPRLARQGNLDVQLVHTLQHDSVVCCVRFSADGKYLATGCINTTQIYDTVTARKICVLVDEGAREMDDLYIRGLCFSPSGKYLATGAGDSRIRIWDIQKRCIQMVFEGHQQDVYSLDFSHDAQLLVSGSADRTVRIWNMNDSSERILTIPESDNVDSVATSVRFSPDGQLVAAGYLDAAVRIWDVQSGQLVECFKGHHDPVYSIAFMPNGEGLVSASLDKTLKYWDIRPILLAGGRGGPSSPGNGNESDLRGSPCTMDFIGHQDYVFSVAVSRDGRWVVSGSKDRGVRLWDANTTVTQCVVQGHKSSVISVDLSPCDNLFATGSGDWQARIWRFGSSEAPVASEETLPGLFSSIRI